MRALTVMPGRAGSGAVRDVAEPMHNAGDVLVDVVRVGLCGTDAEIERGEYGRLPRATTSSSWATRPSGVSRATADRSKPAHRSSRAFVGPMAVRTAAPRRARVDRGCRRPPGATHRHREGVAPSHGRAAPHDGVGPAQRDRHGRRTGRDPRRGEAPPARARRQVAERQHKPEKEKLLARIGAGYAATSVIPLAEVAEQAKHVDVVVEATGNAAVAFECLGLVGANGAVILTSVTGAGRSLEIAADAINQNLVLNNVLVIGSVNAGSDDFRQGIADLAEAQRRWPGFLGELITRRVPLEDAARVLPHDPTQIKTVVEVHP